MKLDDPETVCEHTGSYPCKCWPGPA